MKSSVLGATLKTPGECTINGIGLFLSQKGKSFMWPLSGRIEIDLVLILNLFFFFLNELPRDR